ncbi:MAG: HAD family hydrolase [Candidatus Micrarchaeota archaeon]
MAIVVFDLDGTLIDSMKIRARMFANELDVSPAVRKKVEWVFLRNTGVLVPTEALASFQKTGVNLSGEELDEAFRKVVQKWNEKPPVFPLKKGVKRTLEQLRREGHVVVLSSFGPGQEVKRILNQHKMRHLFDGVFTYSGKYPQFAKGPGHNKFVREIARRMGKAGQRVIYVGDGVHDMANTRRDKRAIAVGITGTNPTWRLKSFGAHHVIREIPEIVRIANHYDRHER